MNTELILKPKKKFSIGGALCLLTAAALLGFLLWEALVNIISVANNLYYVFIQLRVYALYISSSVYLTNAIGNIGSLVTELCSLVTVAALVLFGVLILFKVKTRFLGVILFAPAAVSALSLLLLIVTRGAQVVIWLLFDVSTAVSFFVQYLIYGSISAIPTAAMALCWVALAIVVLVFGGSKKYSEKKAALSIVVAAIMALLFVSATAVGFGAALLSNGLTVLGWFMDIVRGYPMFGRSFVTSAITVLLSLLYSVVKCGVLGALYGLAVFFSVKWIIAPFKKVR